MPNKLSQFWQELKRRNVVRVITVYVAVAFMILEAVDIIFPRMGLPDWTVTLVIFLLAIGLIISIILSWIYDIHPEGGMVKTKPADKVKSEDIPKSSNSWKIASYISFAVIVGLIVLNVMPRNKKETVSEIIDKSIAVLPFVNDSPDEENAYFINGIMDELLINLQTIKELRVHGRTSTEQYRSNPKPIPQIASEMDVAYIVEGSGQRYGDNIRLRIQLVEGATDRHIWADSYEEVIHGPEDVFRIQSAIARAIAAELQAVITPSEKELIDKVSTTNLTAYDLYQRGREEHWNGNIDRAEELYHKALENDPTFAQAYNGLAAVYWNKHGREEYLSESYLDSVRILTDIALSHDPNLSETYVIRGRYYGAINNREQAIIEFDKALQLNPNDWMAYGQLANIYYGAEPLKTIENLHKAISLNRGQGLAGLLNFLSNAYKYAGFKEQSIKYAQQYLELTGDSVFYYFINSGAIYSVEQIEILLKAYRLDSTRWGVNYGLGESYLFLGNYEEALKYFEKRLKSGWGTDSYHRLGLAYWYNGDKEKAEYYIDKQLEIALAQINLGRQWAGVYYSYFDLAGIYAFKGEKDKALEYLRMFNLKKNFQIHIVNFMHTDPFFDNIRDEPEFQQITRDIEAKYQAEHERIRQWLEENEML